MSATSNIADVLEGRARWAVVCADNADVLPTLADKSVAHVITDPPYDAQTHDGARTLWGTGARWRTERQRKRAEAIAIDFEPLSDFAVVAEALRVAERWVLAFCTVEMLGDYRHAAGEAWVRGGIWNRTDSTPQLSGDRPAQGCEGVAVMHRKGRKKWNGGGHRAVWSHGIERDDRAHPTQKPVDLMLELVSLFTDPDELILDPFCGSGTTGVACLRLGRRFIGIEKSEAYAAVARERLEAESRGLSLTAARHGQTSIFDTLNRCGMCGGNRDTCGHFVGVGAM